MRSCACWGGNRYVDQLDGVVVFRRAELSPSSVSIGTRSSMSAHPWSVALGAWTLNGTIPIVAVASVSASRAMCSRWRALSAGRPRGAQRALADEHGDVRPGLVEDRLAAQARGDRPGDLLLDGAGLRRAQGRWSILRA
jgi:hypothetical protein